MIYSDGVRCPRARRVALAWAHHGPSSPCLGNNGTGAIGYCKILDHRWKCANSPVQSGPGYPVWCVALSSRSPKVVRFIAPD